ncbi:MAG: hypothetical protein A2550_06355 [Candidatus Jacksonbacteria bacterium RIFOXYD2_FULL_43_21]|nr:MAG: hypothetical protein A2550_06355 [Candidatus Jacksonbacteria bacterium RIFOXYD2_FULL_43_21]
MVLITKEKAAQKKVLVTGGAGFIGSNLCLLLLEKGYTVYAVDNFVTGNKKNVAVLRGNSNFKFYELDITAPEFIAAMQEVSLHYIFHLACPTGVPNIAKLGKEMLLTSALGTFNVMELARRQKARVVFTSSCEVYGQPENFPQKESYNGNVNPIGPRSPYEEGKRFAESVVAYYVRKYGAKAVIVRFFNVYGPGMSLGDQRVIPQFINSILNKQELTIYGDGRQSRSFLYVDDATSGLLTVLAKGAVGEVYNVGSEKEISIRDLADLIKTICRQKNGIKFAPHFIEDHHSRCPSTLKLKSLGWQPLVNLEEGLIKMKDSLQSL